MMSVVGHLVVMSIMSGVLKYLPNRCTTQESPSSAWHLYSVLSTGSKDFNESDDIRSAIIDYRVLSLLCPGKTARGSKGPIEYAKESSAGLSGDHFVVGARLDDSVLANVCRDSYPSYYQSCDPHR